MSKNPLQFLTFATEKEKATPVSLKSLVAKYIYNWPLIAASVLFMLLVAFLYLQIADPLYQVKATLLVTPQKTIPTAQDGNSVLDKIDLPNTADIVENEVAKLRSAKLINQVIGDLQLATIYQRKKGFSYKDIYATVPFKFVTIKANPDYDAPKNKLYFKTKDANSFLLKGEDGGFKAYPYSTIMHTEFGTWKLNPTSDVGMFKDADIRIAFMDPDKLTEYYQKNIDVSLEDKLATAVDLTINTADKEKGKAIINQLIAVYNADEIGDKNKETENTVKFIDQRLSSLTGELTNAEKNIENFKSSNNLTDLTSDAKFQLEKLQTNDTRLSEINVQLSIIDGVQRYISSPNTKERAPAVIGINDPSLVSSIEKLSNLQLQRDQLLATTPETNPDFEQLDSQIKTTRATIAENVRNIRTSLTNAQRQLQTTGSSSESSISNLPSQERKFISIKRQQSIKENLYVYLLQKREEVSLRYATTVSNHKVLDSAYSLPSKWPNKKIIYALALVLGIILPMAAIFLFHLLKGVILDPVDIEKALEVPVFSEVAFDNASPLAVSGNGLVNEQFRNLRAKLYDLHSDDDNSRVTLLTSSISGEGKSFVSSNLGLVVARAGKKTVLLELDLRRSSIKDIFKLSKERLGITDYLKGKSQLKDIIQPSGADPLLHIISSGTVVTNPSELLENGKLKQLLAELRDQYDDVIIDSPPVHLVTDANIIARLSDITLYMIRQGVTKKSELKFIKQLLKDGKLPKMQIVFNGVDSKKFGYGYDYDTSYYKTAPLNTAGV